MLNRFCAKQKRPDYQYFKDQFNLEEREKQFQKINLKFPYMIPIILEISAHSDLIEPLKTKKFIISKGVKLYEFSETVRKKLDFKKEGSGLYLFINNKQLESLDRTLQEIYEKSKDKEDGFLYISYSDIPGFGASSS